MEVVGDVSSNRGTAGTDFHCPSPRSSLALWKLLCSTGSQPSAHAAPRIPPGLAGRAILLYKRG